MTWGFTAKTSGESVLKEEGAELWLGCAEGQGEAIHIGFQFCKMKRGGGCTRVMATRHFDYT